MGGIKFANSTPLHEDPEPDEQGIFVVATSWITTNFTPNLLKSIQGEKNQTILIYPKSQEPSRGGKRYE
jgi:hypothetical protein